MWSPYETRIIFTITPDYTHKTTPINLHLITRRLIGKLTWSKIRIDRHEIIAQMSEIESLANLPEDHALLTIIILLSTKRTTHRHPSPEGDRRSSRSQVPTPHLAHYMAPKWMKRAKQKKNWINGEDPLRLDRTNFAKPVFENAHSTTKKPGQDYKASGAPIHQRISSGFAFVRFRVPIVVAFAFLVVPKGCQFDEKRQIMRCFLTRD